VTPSGQSPPIDHALGLDYLEIGFLGVLAAFVMTSWLNFTLAEFGLARPLVILALGGVVVALGGGLIFRHSWRRPTLVAMAGLVLPLVLGAVLFFPPDEWILGGLDPGSYVNAGATIARTGRIVLHDPDLATLDPAVRQILLPLQVGRLPGFYQASPEFSGPFLRGFVNSTDNVVPHGFHLFPAVLSFGFALDGIRGELLIPPLLAETGLAAFYLLARRLFGTSVASASAILLALSPAEIWFARYPTAEGLSQVLLFGGFLALVTFLDLDSRWLAVLAGLSLGAAHLTKIETLPLPFLIAAFLSYQILVRGFDRRWLWFLFPYGVLLLQAVFHAVYVSTLYTVNWYDKILSPRQMSLVLAFLLGSLCLTLAILFVPKVRNSFRRLIISPVWETPIGWLIPAATGLLALYAYYLRPLEVPTLPAAVHDLSQWSAPNDALSFVRLGWYITPIGVLLGTLGWMLIGHHERNRRTTLPLLVIALDTCLYLFHMFITPIHFWAARRWLTLVIPGFSLATAYVLVAAVPRGPKRFIAVLVPGGLAAVLVIGLYKADHPLLGYVEYRGAVEQLDTLARTFPPNAVLLFPDGDAGQRYSVPLQYIFDRTSFDVLLDPNVESAAGSAARGWLNQGRPVFWVTTADLPDPSAIGLPGQLVRRQRVSLPEKIATVDRPPGGDGVFQLDLIVWQLAP